MRDRPFLANGTVIPTSILEAEIREAKEKQALKEQRRHDFLVAAFGIIGGIISGTASSLIVLWLQGLL